MLSLHNFFLEVNTKSGDNMEKEIMELLDVVLRCLVSLVALFLVTKLIGKRQVSQMSLFDYVIGISIGNFAAEMAINLDSEYLHGTVAVLVFGLVAYLVSIFTIKSLKARQFFIGDPTILIQDGKILYKNLGKVKLDINDLLEECRINGYFDISEIDYALMEANGKVSFLAKPDYQSPINKDLQITELDIVKVNDDDKIFKTILECSLKYKVKYLSFWGPTSKVSWKSLKVRTFLDDKGNIDAACRKIAEAFSFKNKNVRSS